MLIYFQISSCDIEQPTQSCNEGEVYTQCSTACEPKCSDKEDKGCIEICLSPSCQCMEGYARDENNICIPKNNCPKGITKDNNSKTKREIYCNKLFCGMFSIYVCKIINGRKECVLP
uniref:TIL domain-containing protein n=1 Tax=Meloidogyne hapla TaxID=6305 RepID=A0A1I8B4Z9_MELHA